MTTTTYNITAAVLALSVLYGIARMSSPKTAASGNKLGALAMLIAIIVTLLNTSSISSMTIYISLAIGTVIGLLFSRNVTMLQMPQLVALLNGLGGAASMLVAFLVFSDTGAGTIFIKFTAAVALAVGAVTISGSLVAAGKLHRVIPQKPVILPGHTMISAVLIAITIAATCYISFFKVPNEMFWVYTLGVVSVAFGLVFTARVGGADMPITISLLNSLSGVAGAVAGLAIYDPLLVSIGGIVGASGLLLTQIMCRAMNRSLMAILLGQTSVSAKNVTHTKPIPVSSNSEDLHKALTAEDVISNAKKVIIIPGYGMALAQAQHKVKQLADKLEAKGVEVDFAIHPVAGRMPGHMNVLLADANVDHEKFIEMDQVNPKFKDTDLVIVIGANDVVNPAAIHAEGTPIYGMPILRADDAKNIIICNFDLNPGYSGVPNPLYEREGVIMKLGDANKTLDELLLAIDKKGGTVSKADDKAEQLLNSAKKVIIIPGYGMALAQAQHKVKQLADKLEAKGVEVDFAIHPVAGRMPGHMNVLLADANVDHEKFIEMDQVNPKFKDTDLAIVIGANDVVNPAAIHAEGTPIYGMPILRVDEAKNIIICNFDLNPGYSGVPNPLYEREGVIMKLGDANYTLSDIIESIDKGSLDNPSYNLCLDDALNSVEKVIIIPGYGMALAQAQHKVKQLADKLEAKGVEVDFAIHPVAGRMPGHMNVLLADANVDHEKFIEMDQVNPKFKDTDLAIVIGANDVVNPAAIHEEGTPIYGMPILRADDAKNIIICNFDLNPGYSGVPNPLYERQDVILLLGDANESLEKIITSIA